MLRLFFPSFMPKAPGQLWRHKHRGTLSFDRESACCQENDRGQVCKSELRMEMRPLELLEMQTAQIQPTRMAEKLHRLKKQDLRGANSFMPAALMNGQCSSGY